MHSFISVISKAKYLDMKTINQKVYKEIPKSKQCDQQYCSSCPSEKYSIIDGFTSLLKFETGALSYSSIYLYLSVRYLHEYQLLFYSYSTRTITSVVQFSVPFKTSAYITAICVFTSFLGHITRITFSRYTLIDI